jgi:hypothetical protein
MIEGGALGAAVDRFLPSEPREGSIPCSVVVCRRRTSDGKPYCIDHVHMNPYAKRLLAELATMTPAQILGPPDPFAPRKERRRDVVPIEFQVGESRYWVGLVRSRGVEKDPQPTPPTNPRRLRSEFSVRCRPFTLLLTKEQSRHVLLCLQEKRAERIPAAWLVSDQKLLEDVRRRFSSEKAAG